MTMVTTATAFHRLWVEHHRVAPPGTIARSYLGKANVDQTQSDGETRSRADCACRLHLSKPISGTTGLRQCQRHRARQRHPYMKALTPHQTGDDQPGEIGDDVVGAQAGSEQSEHDGADDRLGNARHQGQYSERSNPAALAERLHYALLQSRQLHLIGDKVGVQSELEAERHTDAGRGAADEEKPSPPAGLHRARVWTFVRNGSLWCGWHG